MARRDRIKTAITKYVEIFQPLLEKQTGGMINMEELKKPESEPPIPDRALKLVRHPDNVWAAAALEPIIAELRRSNFPRFYILCKAGYRHGDPGAVRNWKAGETEDARAQHSIYTRTIDWIADEVERRYPKLELRVEIYGEDEEAESPIHVRNRDNAHIKRWRARDGYTKTYNKLVSVEDANPGLTREECKCLLIEIEKEVGRDLSKRTLERSIQHMERGGADLELWSVRHKRERGKDEVA